MTLPKHIGGKELFAYVRIAGKPNRYSHRRPDKDKSPVSCGETGDPDPADVLDRAGDVTTCPPVNRLPADPKNGHRGPGAAAGGTSKRGTLSSEVGAAELEAGLPRTCVCGAKRSTWTLGGASPKHVDGAPTPGSDPAASIGADKSVVSRSRQSRIVDVPASPGHAAGRSTRASAPATGTGDACCSCCHAETAVTTVTARIADGTVVFRSCMFGLRLSGLQATGKPPKGHRRRGGYHTTAGSASDSTTSTMATRWFLSCQCI